MSDFIWAHPPLFIPAGIFDYTIETINLVSQKYSIYLRHFLSVEEKV